MWSLGIWEKVQLGLKPCSSQVSKAFAVEASYLHSASE